MYEGLRADFASEPELLHDLEKTKQSLEDYYKRQYAGKFKSSSSSATAPSPPSTIASKSGASSPQKFSWTSRYQKRNSKVVDELEEFFKLSREDFDTCKPLQWWLGRRAQFPNLYHLACDVFGIPGMFIHALLWVYVNQALLFCQVLLLLLREFFLVVAILFLYVVQVFNQRQSVY